MNSGGFRRHTVVDVVAVAITATCNVEETWYFSRLQYSYVERFFSNEVAGCMLLLRYKFIVSSLIGGSCLVAGKMTSYQQW